MLPLLLLAAVVEGGVSPLALRGSLEAEGGPFPSGLGAQGFDGMLSVRPGVGFSIGEDFGVDLGPAFRIRLFDGSPFNRPSDVGGVLRGADWDELSDFGDILQSLAIFQETRPLHLRLGPVRKRSLGLGHLIWRYSNQTNADYHPAGGQVVARLGPVRGEFLASDILGARLFAGEVAWDMGATFSSSVEAKDRYVLAFEVAHDFGVAGRPFQSSLTTPPVTLLQVDASAAVVRSADWRWSLLAGAGLRTDARVDAGFLLGTAFDVDVKEFGISGRIELRKQAGGFRHGFFGPQYELQRFVDTGLTGASLASVSLPDGFSAFAELRTGLGTRFSLDMAAEYFFFHRLDIDGGLSLSLIDDWLFVAVRSNVVGLLQTPRLSLNAGLRWRLVAGFYVLAEGGTVFMPQVDGALMGSMAFSGGCGFDFER